MSADALEGWLEGAAETAGSWWPDWDAWLANKSGLKVNAREPAPNSAVLSRRRGLM